MQVFGVFGHKRKEISNNIMDINNFRKVYAKDVYDIILKPKDMDISGGKMTAAEIDGIKEYPDVKSIQISGLDQKTFEYFITNYGSQFEAISFFKNKLVSDLSLLGTLQNIKFIYYFFNQKAENLWDMSENKNLTGLSVMNFTRLDNINGIEKCNSLKFFEVGNEPGGGGGCQGIESLKPITKTNIEYLSLYCAVNDNDYNILHNSKIKTMDANIKGWDFEELAEFVGGFRELNGKITVPYLKQGIKTSSSYTEYYYLCKRKRRLIGGKDDEKLKNYVEKFNETVNKYRDNIK